MDHNIVLQQLVANIEKVIIGKKHKVELLMIVLLCKGHVLLEDVPGVGKTSLASALSKSINGSFKRIQFTPDIMPSDVTGFSIFNPQTGAFDYKEGAIFSQIVLADEINRTSPKTQSSLLEAMEEKQVTVDGITYPMAEPFMVLATQNPIEYMGTYPLPEAQMDRFFMRLSLGYPGKKEEMDMLSRYRGENPMEKLAPVVSAAEVVALQRLVEQVYVDERIDEYIVGIVRHTRENPYVELGASPRATINLYKAAQAWALYNNRNYVIPDDVVRMSPHVVSHRIALKQEAKLKEISQQHIVNMAVESIPVPRG